MIHILVVKAACDMKVYTLLHLRQYIAPKVDKFNQPYTKRKLDLIINDKITEFSDDQVPYCLIQPIILHMAYQAYTSERGTRARSVITEV